MQQFSNRLCLANLITMELFLLHSPYCTPYPCEQYQITKFSYWKLSENDRCTVKYFALLFVKQGSCFQDWNKDPVPQEFWSSGLLFLAIFDSWNLVIGAFHRGEPRRTRSNSQIYLCNPFVVVKKKKKAAKRCLTVTDFVSHTDKHTRYGRS